MDNLKDIEALNIHGDQAEVSHRWLRWQKSFKRYYIASGLNKKSKDVQSNTLLHLIGEDAADIYETFTFITEGENKEDKDNIDTIIAKYEELFNPKKRITYLRFKFFTRRQGEETFDKFITDLRRLAKPCEFKTLENELIRDMIICGTRDRKLQEKLLNEDNLTLEKTIKMCQSSEIMKTQIEEIGETPKAQAAVDTIKGKGQEKCSGSNRQENSTRVFDCRSCGKKHGPRQCPAYGKVCSYCHKYNHYASVCRAKKQTENQNVHSLNTNDGGDDDDHIEWLNVSAIGTVDKYGKTERTEDEAYVSLLVQQVPVKFKIDTGAQINVLPCRYYFQMKKNTKLEKTNIKLASYSGDHIGAVMGKYLTRVEGRMIEFFVVDTLQPAILGLKTSEDLGFIKIIRSVKASTALEKYPSVFRGLGCLAKPFKIQIDSKACPVINAPRNTPVALRERIKETLDDMEKYKVIKKVDYPTDWVNSMVVVEKPKTRKLRICLDPKNLNDAIKREHFELPTIDEITTRLTGAKIFSKLDANHGYWQIKLHEDSQDLTTFNTPFGRYKFLRLPFGIKPAQEHFHKRLYEELGDIEGVETDIDDILVWGKTKEEHDERLDKVLERCEKINLTLNPEKCEIGIKRVTYLGHVLSAEGIQPDPQKISAITNMPHPTDKKGIERLLGTVNYLAKFIPNMSEITAAIRMLLKKEVMFEWTHSQEKAMERIKAILSTSPVLAFFDPSKPITISCDASKSGLGAVCIQDGKPVAFASRAMTDTETRYAQIEKELLAVVFAFERFHQYAYGVQCTVESDHKPLEAILKKSLASAPPRLQRMLLRLQKYDFTLKHIPGRDLIVADALSRAYLPISANDKNLEKEIEYMVHATITQIGANDKTLTTIKMTTEAEMNVLMDTIRNGWPETMSETHEAAKPFFNYRDELSIGDGIIFKNSRMVIPPSMRRSMLERLHVGHMGIEKSRQRARQAVFWPGINKDIEETVRSCSECQTYRNSQQKEPMTVMEEPELPWQMVGTDLFKFNKKDYVLVVDYKTKFFEVDILPDTKSTTVVEKLSKMMSTHGIPEVVRSDGGPQYISYEFKEFASRYGFQHIMSSPYYSQGNGLAEAYVQIAKNRMKKSKDPWLAFLEIKNTPIECGESPAKLLMSRELRSVLPVTRESLRPRLVNQEDCESTAQRKKERRTEQYNRGARSLPELQDGEQIRVQVNSEWKPATVVQKATDGPNSYDIVRPNGRQWRRNRRHLMKVPEERNETRNERDEQHQNSEDVIENEIGTEDNKQKETTQECEPEVPYVTAFGRRVVKPTRFGDCSS
jgi:transposase InsO family protein